MKNLYLVGGTMGVGKTAVSEVLKKKLPYCVFLDGDNCWDADPFTVTEETKRMVLDNITHLLNNFLHCPEYRNIVFCWVMHEQSIIDSIVGLLDISDARLIPISLICNEETLRARLSADIDCGKRLPDITERSIARIPLYDKLNTVKIDTTDKSIYAVANEIIAL